jgi:4-hydroxybenzoate polyprenyltransferase
MLNTERVSQYISLMRLNKPIGIFLLLWPTLWAVWLASLGAPQMQILIIFVLGVILMRSAGCILNDAADRLVDVHVQRTRERPLAAGKVSVREALLIAAILSCIAFLLVLQCNALTIALAFVAAALAVIYPFLKRVTHLPQVGLGAAFSFGVPMTFAAETGEVNASAWFLFFTAMFWPVIYDTMYAMADKKDDLSIGVKSTAILFGAMDKMMIGCLQIIFMILLLMTGYIFSLHSLYYVCLLPVLFLFIYQQWLIKDRDAQKCLRAFLNNNWVGMFIFAGIVLSYLQ